ncbi:MAG: helix-turn-helix domain-containing protein [Rubrivivax sp.]
MPTRRPPPPPAPPPDATDAGGALFVASVDKAMRVLSVFGPGRSALTLAEIAAFTGIGRSAAQRFVHTLHVLGYLRRDESSRRYALSTRLLGLVRGMLASHAPLERAQPVMAELARRTGETVSWVELDGDEIVIVANIPSVHVARVHLTVGSRFAALPASSGQVLLWDAPAERVAALLAQLRDDDRARLPPGGEAEVVAGLQRARRAGYALTERHLDPHGVSLSAPVSGVGGQVVAALNISTLKSRYDAARARRELAPALLAACQALSG